MIKTATQKLAVCALFTALIIAGAFIRVPIPPVPFTLQTFFVISAGLLIGPRLGALSALLYMLIGLIGVPVFSFGGGFHSPLHPTFGYIVGFIPGAFIAGLVAEKLGKNSFKNLLLASSAGVILIYILGCVYLYLIKNFYMAADSSVWNVICSGFLVFIPVDIIKVIMASFLAERLKPVFTKC